MKSLIEIEALLARVDAEIDHSEDDQSGPLYALQDVLVWVVQNRPNDYLDGYFGTRDEGAEDEA